jgi:hypothetical protein
MESYLKMKRALFAAFCILALCGLLLINIGTVKASEPGYERIDYMPDPDVTITIDGQWTSDDEWTLNGEDTMIGTDVTFKSVWTAISMTEVYDTFLVEFFSDNTTDTDDYWQMCINGDRSTETTPQTTDYRIDIVNHTDLIVYQGTGLDWTEVTPPASLEWADSLSASPTNSTPHWILEITFLKLDLGAEAYWDFRLVAYDANTTTLTAWPPTVRDDPSRWGYQNYVTAVFPEVFSLGVVVLLSSVAVAVSFYCLRKRPKTQS